MSEPETLYTTAYRPDVSRAEDVLAFLLVPDEAFFDERDTAETKRAVREVMGAAKREALLEWYALRRKL